MKIFNIILIIFITLTNEIKADSENQILDNASVNGFGIADIRCILIILLYPGITFNELLKNISIIKTIKAIIDIGMPIKED